MTSRTGSIQLETGKLRTLSQYLMTPIRADGHSGCKSNRCNAHWGKARSRFHRDCQDVWERVASPVATDETGNNTNKSHFQRLTPIRNWYTS